MKIFICSRGKDADYARKIIAEILNLSENSIAILRELEHSDNWKNSVKKKMQEVDFVIFLLGEKTFESNQIKWEYAKAKHLNKRIVALKLPNASDSSVIFYQGFQVFERVKQCVKYLKKIFEEDRQLLLEQYKIMVTSTEKVTEQRLGVNNLFFTVTSSILSISLVVGKAFNFSITGTSAMIILTTLSFVVTFFWKGLIKSYGKLNKGKFKIIDQIEKKLRTNMFEYEWRILKEEINYEPNTNTEVRIVQNFRYFIIILLIAELLFFLSRL